ncbi:MAG: nucleotidyltransferase substrate binding protein [Bacteriovoracaceae bacterium]|jgi:nucleotidyltransferase substrate binding protein (TIGR01987 family)|nr:nucleotidyltransferase substrate binding protein [Bacteriovoracaceae bacterium]
MAVSTKEFIKATTRLKEALDRPKDEFIRDSVIQRFEFCIELAWKTSKKLMGTTTTAPKQVIREMGQNSYISDVSLWLRAVDERNLSSHTYNEDLAEKVYNFIKDFYPEIEKLADKLSCE